MSEQEITRAEQERYDLETIARFNLLIGRFVETGWLPAETLTKAGLREEQIAACLRFVLHEEGY